jgi:predicted NUDIX family NTP pyrophosphohydrolase
MAKKSAGLLLYREISGHLEVLLVHPGGPFWAKKDEGAWSIPKGEFEDNEDPFSAAKREFAEETGLSPDGEAIPLQPVRQPSGKLIYAWAMRREVDPAQFRSNTFSMEWPPKSGRYQEFPEIDRAAWFTIEAARHKIVKGQAPFLDQLQCKLRGPSEVFQKHGSATSGIAGRRGAKPGGLRKHRPGSGGLAQPEGE